MNSPAISENTTTGTQVFADALSSAMAQVDPANVYTPASESSSQSVDSTAMLLMCMMMNNNSDSDVNDVLYSILVQMLTGRDSTAGYSGELLGSDSSTSENQTSKVYDSIVKAALTRLGDRYSKAKAGQADYTDCSYLSRWCYREVGIELPRTAAAQAKYCADNGMTISKEELKPGDLIFFSLKKNGRFKNISHVGIYAGDGMMVDASSVKGKVVHRKLFDEGQVLYARPTAK